MATLWERAAHSVNYMLYLYYVYLFVWFFFGFPFWFRGQDYGSNLILVHLFSFLLLGLWKTEWAGNVLLKCHPWCPDDHQGLGTEVK